MLRLQQMEQGGAELVKTARDLLRFKMGTRRQRDFARELGVSQSMVSRVLSGERVFGARLIARIAAVYPDLRQPLAEALLDNAIPEDAA